MLTPCGCLSAVADPTVPTHRSVRASVDSLNLRSSARDGDRSQRLPLGTHRTADPRPASAHRTHAQNVNTCAPSGAPIGT